MKFLMIMTMAIVFGYVENDYFGWNWKAGSFEELMADGITFLLVAIALTQA